eukprot:EG_transcript_13539
MSGKHIQAPHSTSLLFAWQSSQHRRVAFAKTATLGPIGRRAFTTAGALSHPANDCGALASPVEDLVVAYITVTSMEVGKGLARHLVQSKLAACVNVVPGVVSVYEWQGKLEEDNELLLVVKTRREHLAAIAAVLKDKRYHPYDTAELVALPIVAGAQDYVEWVRAGTNRPAGPPSAPAPPAP